MPRLISFARWGRHSLLAALLLLFVGSASSTSAQSVAAIVLEAGTPYTQSFDTLADVGTSNAVPNGWIFRETENQSNLTYSASDGSLDAVDSYSFGSAGSSERAFGGIGNAALTPTVGARFRNRTDQPLTQLHIRYTGERWRVGSTGRSDRLDFQYSLDATSLSSGTWIDVDALDFIAPAGSAVGAQNGNTPANGQAIGHTITGLTIPDGSTFWIRWRDVDAEGADDGLAIDNIRVSDSALSVVLSAFDAIRQDNGNTRVRWTSTDERNTVGYHVWRGSSPITPETQLTTTMIPALAGGTPSGASYDWTDGTANGTAYFYWLEDVDSQQVTMLHGPVYAQPQEPSAVTLGGVATAAPAWPTMLIALLSALGLLGAYRRLR